MNPTPTAVGACAPIRFEFDPAKAAQAAAVLLRRDNGRMPYMRLIKLLYLADRESLHRFRRPIVGGRYVGMKLGPVISQVLDAIRDDVYEAWSSLIHREGYDVSFAGECPPTGKLSRADVEILEQASDLYRQLDQWRLSKLTHDNLPEWHEPGTGCFDIAPEDILRALGQSDEAIEQVREDAQDDVYFNRLFAAHS